MTKAKRTTPLDLCCAIQALIENARVGPILDDEARPSGQTDYIVMATVDVGDVIELDMASGELVRRFDQKGCVDAKTNCEIKLRGLEAPAWSTTCTRWQAKIPKFGDIAFVSATDRGGRCGSKFGVNAEIPPMGGFCRPPLPGRCRRGTATFFCAVSCRAGQAVYMHRDGQARAL
jgi:hypothetical protein